MSVRTPHDDRFRRVVDGAPNAMVAVDAQGLIVLFNTQAESTFGYNREEVFGKPIEMLVPNRSRAAHPHLRQGYLGTPGVRAMGAGRELYALRADGSEFPVEIGLNPIETDEGMLVLAAIIDISERKLREKKIADDLREKELLLGEIHHRVKNNLQVIDSLLGLQSAQIDDPGASSLLRDSQNRVKSMATIHQILYQSHNFAHVDFSSVVDRLTYSLRSSYGRTDDRIAIRSDCGAVLLPIRQAIPLGLIFNELLSNVFKHAFPAPLTGSVDVTLNSTPDGLITLAVADNGVGIPPEFDVDNAASLGLQLVKLLCDQLQGELELSRNSPTRMQISFQIEEQEMR
jgi:two-component system, sensor histidine kinase PdtaS